MRSFPDQPTRSLAAGGPRFHIEPLTAVVDARDVHDMDDIVSIAGGTAAGIALIRTITASSRLLSSPEAFLAFPDQDSPILYGDLIEGSNWAIKYSGSAESFSRHARRGRDSSNGRRLASGISARDRGSRLSDVWRVRPAGTICLVLQQFLDLERPYSLVYFDIGTEFIWLELVQSIRRLLAVFSHSGALLYQESAGSVEPLIDRADLFYLLSCADELRSRAGGLVPNMNVEGIFFGRTEPLALLQLRPTPGDRPHDNLELRAEGALPSQQDVLWSTRFVWGAYDFTIENGNPLGLDVPFLLRGISERTPMAGQSLFSAYDDGLFLADTVSGFRMTHEPWNLPPVDKRAGYSFLYLPERILEFSASRPIRISCDGDIAIVRSGLPGIAPRPSRTGPCMDEKTQPVARRPAS